MITIKNLTNEEFEENFQNYYNNWDVVNEGFDPSKENVDYLENNILKPYMKTDSIEVHVVTGKMFNDKMCLTGPNTYQDDLNILIIKQSDLDNIETFAVKERFMYGFRWFTDVVDNKRERQNRLDNGNIY